MSKSNILLLPSTALEMESEIESFMQKKDFKSALTLLEELLSYEHHTYPVFRDTLICLMKLHFTDDALDMCEDLLLDQQSDHYYDYLEFYMMLLYEKEKYEALIDLFERDKNQMPEDYVSRTKEFYILAKQMRKWQQEEALVGLVKAMKEKDVMAQYRQVQKWKQQRLPIPDLFEEMLADSSIHPVIKTELFIYLQETGVEKEILVEKMGQSLFITPSSMVPLTRNESYLTCISVIEDTEQQDPVLYMLAKEIIDNHAFVLYPLLYNKDSASTIAHHALKIAKANLGTGKLANNLPEVETILMYQELYQEIKLQ